MTESAKIVLGFNPNVTLDFIETALKKDFPDCEIGRDRSLGGTYIYIRENAYVEANVFVKHKNSAGKSVIKIEMMTPETQYWLRLYSLMKHYTMRGDFCEQVEDAIRDALRESLGVKW